MEKFLELSLVVPTLCPETAYTCSSQCQTPILDPCHFGGQIEYLMAPPIDTDACTVELRTCLADRGPEYRLVV